jgi:hypothetical protein
MAGERDEFKKLLKATEEIKDALKAKFEKLIKAGDDLADQVGIDPKLKRAWKRAKKGL